MPANIIYYYKASPRPEWCPHPSSSQQVAPPCPSTLTTTMRTAAPLALALVALAAIAPASDAVISGPLVDWFKEAQSGVVAYGIPNQLSAKVDDACSWAIQIE